MVSRVSGSGARRGEGDSQVENRLSAFCSVSTTKPSQGTICELPVKGGKNESNHGD